MSYIAVLQSCNKLKRAFGTSINLKYARGNLASLSTTGNTSQTVTHQGKNLLENQATTQTVNGITFTVNTDKSITMNGTATDYAVFQVHPSKLIILAGTQFTFSFHNASANSNVSVFMRTQTQGTYDIKGVVCNVINKTLTGTAMLDDTYFDLRVASGTTLSNFTVSLQLEVGSTATTYTQFVPESPSPGYQAPIHGVSKTTVNGTDYAFPQTLFTGDAYDVISGQGTAQKKEIVFDGSSDENYVFTSAGTNCARFDGTPLIGAAIVDADKINCDKFTSKYNDYTDTEHCRNSSSQYPNSIIFYILKYRLSGWSDSWTNAQKVTAFKTWLASNLVTVLYQLATPATITGTPQTIPSGIPTAITNDNGGQMVVIYPAIFERVAYTSRAFDHHTIHELMRMYTLQAAVANTDSVRRYIAPGVSLECDGQLYDLTGYKKESGSNNTTSFDAEHVGYRLLNYQIQPGYSFVGTVAQIAADILDVAVDSKGNKASSEFEIGETPDLGTISFTLNNTDVVTAKYVIMALKNFGAESDYDNFTINFYQQIGGGQTQTFEFGVNMENVTITYSLTNGTTYEANIADLQIKDPEDHPFDVGWYGHGIDSTTGEEFTKRIITYDKCHDNTSQNKIALGVFVSDVSTQTAQMQVQIDGSVQQGQTYNNVDISHQFGFRSTSGDGLMRTLNNGTDGFVIQRLVNENWVTIWEAESASGKTIAYNLDHSQKVEMGGDYGYTTWTSSDHGTTWTQTGGQGTDGNIQAGKLISTLYPLISAIIGQFVTSKGTERGLGINYDGNTKLALCVDNNFASIQTSVFTTILNVLGSAYTQLSMSDTKFECLFGDGSNISGYYVNGTGLHCYGGRDASFTIGGDTFNFVGGILME